MYICYTVYLYRIFIYTYIHIQNNIQITENINKNKFISEETIGARLPDKAAFLNGVPFHPHPMPPSPFCHSTRGAT